MGYVEKTLVEDECVLQTGRLHWIIYERTAWLVLFAIAAFFISRSSGLATEYRGALALVWLPFSCARGHGANRRVHTALHDRNSSYDEALRSQTRSHSPFGDGNRSRPNREHSIDQSIPGRVFGYGTIVVAGTGSGIDPVRPVARPLVLRKALDRLYRPTR
jgi:hypothetical protein